MTILSILGSSRADGDTARLLSAVLAHLPGTERVDLGTLRIGPYSYSHANADDDFLPLAQAMLKAQAIVLASPVYWYTMSAQMKLFFDRLSDLTDPPYKTIGKQLAGKTLFVVATGSDPKPPESFVHPFEDSAGYFNMQWGGVFYRPGAPALSDEHERAAHAFASDIAAAR
ncbi:flavodoxin family protein [Marinicaulis aureus]|uniref:Flavodoxin family protein n=1 Tax=Hyphococcus aureus TaxID=2666033 RepID=A0ABW1KWV6_9PROT